VSRPTALITDAGRNIGSAITLRQARDATTWCWWSAVTGQTINVNGGIHLG
jgi:hypothetical protein